MKPHLTRLLPLLLVILGSLPVACTAKFQVTPAPFDTRELIITSRDLGWPDNAYTEYTGNDATILGQQNVAQAITIYIKPQEPKRSSRGGQIQVGIQGAIQDIWVYANEDRAGQDFLYITELYEIGHPVDQEINLLPLLNQSWWDCQEGRYSPEIGSYTNCWLLVQHGNVVIRGVMTIDDMLVTYDHWETFKAKIHERLVGFVTESSSTP